ncbi:MAG: DUF2752 domain-containing protein [Acidothermaceae bacterium]
MVSSGLPGRVPGMASSTVSGAVSGAQTAWSNALVRAVSMSGAALVVAHLSIPGRPATLCPFRAITGIPCPICGSTTAAMRLGHLDLVGAMRANPFTVVAGLALVLAPVFVAKRKSRTTKLQSTRVRVRVAALCVTIAALSELWQLFRFHII